MYESLYASARSSSLSQTDPFDGYRFIEPVLDKELLAEGAAAVKQALRAKL